MMDEKLKRSSLTGNRAINLWKAGVDNWNEWVEKNPKYDIDFRGEIFNRFKSSKGIISFRDYKFPDGKIDFSLAEFGDGKVIFSGAQFVGGEVIFEGSQFGGDGVDFSKTHFGAGLIKFSDVKFGDGDIIFTGASFGDGVVFFNNAEFGKGFLDFSETEFGNTDIIFYKVQFGDGDKCFNLAEFGNGDISFNCAEFGDGHIWFDHAQFGDGRVDFSLANFGNGIVSFGGAKFGEGEVIFAAAHSKGRFYFKPAEIYLANKIDFSSCVFEGELSLSEIKTSAVVDLRHSQLNRPIDLDKTDIDYQKDTIYNLKVQANQEKNGSDEEKKDTEDQVQLEPVYKWQKWFNQAKSSDAATCFRRLKKLAKDADDHERALDFFAKEMRCSYWHTLKGWKLAFYYLYDWLSDYGRSVVRPFLGLVVTWFMFSVLYCWKSTSDDAPALSMLFSLGHTIPFYPGSRAARTESLSDLFVGSPDSWVQFIHAATIGQGMISAIFLFLIALALRNLFRS